MYCSMNTKLKGLIWENVTMTCLFSLLAEENRISWESWDDAMRQMKQMRFFRFFNYIWQYYGDFLWKQWAKRVYIYIYIFTETCPLVLVTCSAGLTVVLFDLLARIPSVSHRVRSLKGFSPQNNIYSINTLQKHMTGQMWIIILN